MRIIDSAILSELQQKTIRPFVLIKMCIDSVYYRYTNCDVPIALGYVKVGLFPSTTLNPSTALNPGPIYEPGDLFSPRGFEVSAIRYSSSKIVDSLDLNIDNLDDVLTPVFVGGNPAESPVYVILALFDSSYQLIGDIEDPYAILFQGYIDQWELNEESVVITIASLFTEWTQTTLSRHPPSCRWKKFKGTECGYSGTGDTCDRSYAQCTAYSNTDNFGGFRWLPSLEHKEIWWGRSKK